jgi:FkbM family methyltransferase
MSAVAIQKAKWVPTIRSVDSIVPGCRFHIGSGVENFRVSNFGGEREFTQQMVQAIRPGEVFYDIGTCIGFVAVHAAKRGAKVVAFEPEPQLRARAKENLFLNRADVQIIDWAVSDGDGSAELFSDGPHGCSPTLAATEGRTPVKVATRSIDAAIADGTIPTPHLVKLDIEGAEIKALRGMRTQLTSPNRPRQLFIEVHPPMIQSMGDDPTDLNAILESAGYRLTFEQVRNDQMHHIWTAE